MWEERDEREREREREVDSIDLPSVLRRWKCVLMLLERKRERFVQVVVAGVDGDDRETTDIFHSIRKA